MPQEADLTIRLLNSLVSIIKVADEKEIEKVVIKENEENAQLNFHDEILQ